jgi:capsular exopolysaccharide synthesis family protein
VGSSHDMPISVAGIAEFIRRGLLLALLFAVVAAAAAFYLSSSVPPSYRARATLLVSQPSASYRDAGIITPPPIDPNIYRTAITAGPVLADVRSTLESGDFSADVRSDLSQNIVVTTDSYEVSSLVHIDVVNASPEVAAEVANVVADALLRWDRNRISQNAEAVATALADEVTALDAQLNALREVLNDTNQEQYNSLLARREARLADLSTAGIQSNLAVVGLLELFSSASPPEAPVPTRTTFNTALAFLLGLVSGYGLVALRVAGDTRIRSSDELIKVTGLPVMAEFPRRTARANHLSQEASSYLRTNILFATAQAHPKIIMISSAQTAAEKGGLALNLSESFARSEHRTLLIDADLRRPITGRAYNLDPARHASLQLYLEDPDADYHPASIPIAGANALDVIPSFVSAQAPAELLSQGFKPFLERWKDRYDVIVINATPLLPVADALIIAPLCTGTVLSTSLRNSSYRQVRNAVTLLQRFDIRVLGVVATEVTYGYEQAKRHNYNASRVSRDN